MIYEARKLEPSRQRWEAMRGHLLTLYPDLSTDDEAMFDTLDGLTDFTDQIAEVIRSADLDKRFSKAIAEKIIDLQSRKAWLTQKSDKKRSVALHAMQDADIKKITAADMTIFRSSQKPGTQIINEDLIPKEYFKTVRTLDRAKLRAALDAGEDISGATLSNTTEKLTVR